IIISTDMYTVFRGEEFGDDMYEAGSLDGAVEPGPGYVQAGFDAFAPGLGASFVAITLAFFTFTTMVAYYYMAEVNLSYLTRKIKSGTIRRGLIRVLQGLILVSVAYGAVTTAGSAWGLGDIGVGSMAWLNILGILLLQVPALKALKDYRQQKKQGLDPQFDPRPLGIKSAEVWELRADGRELQGKAGQEGTEGLPPAEEAGPGPAVRSEAAGQQERWVLGAAGRRRGAAGQGRSGARRGSRRHRRRGSDGLTAGRRHRPHRPDGHPTAGHHLGAGLAARRAADRRPSPRRRDAPTPRRPDAVWPLATGVMHQSPAATVRDRWGPG